MLRGKDREGVEWLVFKNYKEAEKYAKANDIDMKHIEDMINGLARIKASS
ncbi:hypothetical protein OAF54_00175 [bacterium]|nr:hypothetical protein [bacterium]